MIIYLGGNIQLHNLEIKTPEELDKFKKDFMGKMEELYDDYFFNFFGSSIEIEWEEQSGEFDN